MGGAGEGGQVLSLADTADLWARRNGCGLQDRPVLAPGRALDRTRILHMTYQNCPAAGRVQVLTVAGGGPAWPGGMQFALPRVIGLASRQIDVSSAIVDFFLSLPPR
jgi:polyhydroxybutyrate depolymerase